MTESRKCKSITDYLQIIWELGPMLLSIVLGDLLLVFIFLTFGASNQQDKILSLLIADNTDTTKKFSYALLGFAILEAMSTWLVGKLADVWTRKRILIIVHMCALLFLIAYYFYENFYILMAAGIIFSPGPAARAAIIDNFKSNIVKSDSNNIYKTFKLSESRLIGFSWIAQYLPWCLFPFISTLSHNNYLIFLIIIMAIGGLSILLVFSDELDKKLFAHHAPFFSVFVKSPFTLSALLLSQLAFFIPFEKIEYLPHNHNLFFLVGLGATIGTLISLFYRKTPHVSVVTNSYGIGFMLSITTLLYFFSAGVVSIPIELQIIQISALGGFYLPFVYDVIISKVGADHRATMFACAEVAQAIASTIGMIIATLLRNGGIALFSFTACLFLGAVYLQLKEEKRGRA